ncbi:hypothetical protein [Chitinophaga sancti]|nr:hypothetical protein [Chitinophaga sancti]WQD59638.1 hypothetical protein U0033_17260 [Chitinophaga sancti]WQG88231.1 hypothetical protein SR876_25205 [Chitinophaga sancti]
MADGLFYSVSIVWFTILVKIIIRPNQYLIILNGIFIGVALSLRYHALYYPILGAFAFLLSQYRFIYKALGVVFQLAIVLLFVFFTQNQVKQITGQSQFSPFGGWKIANNTLYVYENIYRTDQRIIPNKYRELDSIVRRYYNSAHRKQTLFTNDPMPGGFYVFMSYSPLVIYKNSVFHSESNVDDVKSFMRVGGLYGDYGKYLLKGSPVAYLKFFIIPNVIRYFSPPAELYITLSTFFLRRDNISNYTKKWFHFKTLEVNVEAIQFRSNLFSFFPSIVFKLHVIFLLMLSVFIFIGGLKLINIEQRKFIALGIITWIIDFGFNILASEVVLRYLLFTITIEVIFVLQFASIIIKWTAKKIIHKK